MVKEIKDKQEKEIIARTILNDLEDWFGIPEYTKDYIQKSKDLPFFAAYKDKQAIGFIVLKETSPYTAEIYCMGILKAYHRHGFGKALFDAFQVYAKDKGYKFLQVKTVEQGKYHAYDLTNAFYKSLGFYELEVFPNLWDEHNPCQIFVKAIV
jgi:ribosomal protein S18 acetylase RimI-like enzyme